MTSHVGDVQHCCMPATTKRHLRTPRIAFADLIHGARREAGLSQQALADAAGIDRATIIRWESGNASRPEGDVLRSVCQVLHLVYLEALMALGTIVVREVDDYLASRAEVAA